MSPAQILQKLDITELENLVFKNGLIKPVPAADLNRIGQQRISLFCHKHAVYQMPTTELIDFLKAEMIGTTIEVGAGNGCIGRALGITMTDNYSQTWHGIKEYYRVLKQPTISYGHDVEQMDGNEAVIKYGPQTVIGCWVTQRFQSYMTEGKANACVYGPEEELFFQHGVKKYIMVGNELSHGDKEIFKKRKVRKVNPGWLYSRSMDAQKNVIYIIE